MAGYMYMWEYYVALEHVDEFQRVYGPSGAWVQLFRRAPGYVRTELHRDRARAGRFVTIDYWESEAAWRAFRAQFADEFETLDAECAALALRETQIGRFDPVLLTPPE